MPNTGENWEAVWRWAGATDTNAWNPWHFPHWFCEAWASGVMGMFILACLAIMIDGLLCKDGSGNDAAMAFPFAVLIGIMPVWIVAMLPVIAPFLAAVVVAWVVFSIRYEAAQVSSDKNAENAMNELLRGEWTEDD